ncbi:unnamed protein product [Sympodiomycopsis kandeliae]
MLLPRHTLSSQTVAPALVSATFAPDHEDASQDTQDSAPAKHLVTCATRSGFVVSHTWPLKIVARRDYPPDQGALSIACPVGNTSLILLVGGGRVPRYAPNKVIVWDESASGYSQDDPKLNTIKQDIGSPAPSLNASTVFDAETAFVSRESLLQDQDVLSHSPSGSRPSTESMRSSNESVESASSASVHSSISSASEKDTSPFKEKGRASGPDSAKQDPSGTGTRRVPGRTDATVSSRKPDGTKTESTGKEVMELEFDEAVVSVRAQTFPLPRSQQSKQATNRGAALLVVVLKTKALLFEFGHHIGSHSEEPSQAGWGIVHRTTIPVLNDGIGLVDIARLPTTNRAILVLSGRQPGHLQLLLLSLTAPSATGSPSSGVLASSIVAAHSASVVSLCLSHDGRTLATASLTGTLVRVWSTIGSSASVSQKSRASVKATLRHELRRGTEQASILSMSFSPDCSVLAAASDKGTIHFFNLVAEATGDASGASTPTSSGSGRPASTEKSSAISLSKAASKYLPSALNQLASQLPPNMIPQYLKSQWSAAQFRIKLKRFAAHTSEERSKRISQVMSTNSPQDRQLAADRSPPVPSINDASKGDAGIARSTEGAWATLRGRIEDIRRWEPALDERIFLTWVTLPSKEDQASTCTQNDSSPRPYHLIALTSSGSWYRISLTDRSSSGTDGAPRRGPNEARGTVLDMYKGQQQLDDRGASQNQSKISKDGTTLEEYQVLNLKDDWSL